MPAPINYASSKQINAIVPYSVAGRQTTQMKVTYGTSTTPAVTLQVTDTAPAIASFDASGTGQGAIINQNGTLNSATQPAPAGSIVSLYIVGFGQTDPQVADDAAPAAIAWKTKSPVSVLIGGQQAVVQYSGNAPGFAGLMQVNAQVPASLAGAGPVPVIVIVGNAASQPNLTMVVK